MGNFSIGDYLTIGDIVSALIRRASDISASGDDLLLQRAVYSIEANDDGNIEISFVDRNTEDIVIDTNGKLVSLLHACEE